MVAKVKKKATKTTITNNVDKSNTTSNAESNADSNNIAPIDTPTTIVMNNDGESRLVNV